MGQTLQQRVLVEVQQRVQEMGRTLQQRVLGEVQQRVLGEVQQRVLGECEKNMEDMVSRIVAQSMRQNGSVREPKQSKDDQLGELRSRAASLLLTMLRSGDLQGALKNACEGTLGDKALRRSIQGLKERAISSLIKAQQSGTLAGSLDRAQQEDSSLIDPERNDPSHSDSKAKLVTQETAFQDQARISLDPVLIGPSKASLHNGTTAAITIQAQVRGRQARKEVEDQKSVYIPPKAQKDESAMKKKDHLEVGSDSAKAVRMSILNAYQWASSEQGQKSSRKSSVLAESSCKSCGGSGKVKPDKQLFCSCELGVQVQISKLHSAVRWGKAVGEIQEIVKACPLHHQALQVLSKEDPKTGNTALHIAAQNGHLELVRYMLNEGVGIDPQNNVGNTPLHMSVEYELYFVTKLLIDKGANPKKKNQEGHDALLGINGTKTGSEVWNNPLSILKAADDDAEQMDFAMGEIERADPASLDKSSLAKIGMQKSKECKVNWDKARFLAVVRKL
jgi:hypothetical protein